MRQRERRWRRPGRKMEIVMALEEEGKERAREISITALLIPTAWVSVCKVIERDWGN